MTPAFLNIAADDMTHILIRRSSTRLRTWLLLAVFGLLAAIAYALPAPASSASNTVVNPVNHSTWRRTRNGWEQLNGTAPSPPPVYRPLHPACLVTFQALMIAMALVAYRSTSLLLNPEPGYPLGPLNPLTDTATSANHGAR